MITKADQIKYCILPSEHYEIEAKASCDHRQYSDAVYCIHRVCQYCSLRLYHPK